MADEVEAITETVHDAIVEVLRLQPHFTASPSPAMSRRRDALLSIESHFREAIASAGNHVIQVKGSNGAGNNAKVPWVRAFDPAQSPRPTRGWYVVLLFSADGSSAFLSLNQGVTQLAARDVDLNVSHGWDRIKTSDVLPEVPTERSTRQISLKDPGLGAQYERGNLLAFEYSIDSVPDDETVQSDLSQLLELLEVLPAIDGLPSASSDEKPSSRDGSDLPDQQLRLLTSAIHWSEERVLEIVESMIDESPQVVLVGPPGTGKTFVARHLAAYLLDQAGQVDSNPYIEVVQFHPSYGYEEFVEGLRPVPSAVGGFQFEAVAGAIVKLAEAIGEDGLPRVLIIDEMNRANLPRVFGELYYLLEYRDQNVRLMYRDKFALPKELMIIGTMNTADRSIRSVDFALRRRFDFFDVLPSSEILRAHYAGTRVNQLGEVLFNGFDSLNLAVNEAMGDRHHGVGHSYFMRSRMNTDVLQSVWSRQVFPLLEEYLSGSPGLLEEFQLERFFGPR